MLKPPRKRRRLRRNKLFKKKIPQHRLLVIFHMVAYSLINLTISMGDVDYDWLYEFLKEHTIQEDIEYDKKLAAKRKWATFFITSLYISLSIIKEIFKL